MTDKRGQEQAPKVDRPKRPTTAPIPPPVSSGKSNDPSYVEYQDRIYRITGHLNMVADVGTIMGDAINGYHIVIACDEVAKRVTLARAQWQDIWGMR